MWRLTPLGQVAAQREVVRKLMALHERWTYADFEMWVAELSGDRRRWEAARLAKHEAVEAAQSLRARLPEGARR